jgi:octaprenyl-diphosphate synthase
MMVDVDNMQVMKILSEATNTIAEGEVLQLMNCHDADTTEDRYLDVIRYKTAKLFEAAAELGALINNASAADQASLASYGMHLGTAFQLIDDVLDYSASSDEIGKNIGDDLSEGKPTLPLIYTMRHGSEKASAVVREAIEKGGLNNIADVMQAIESTDAIKYTADCAKAEADRAIAALDCLPASVYKEALQYLAEFSISRSF